MEMTDLSPGWDDIDEVEIRGVINGDRKWKNVVYDSDRREIVHRLAAQELTAAQIGYRLGASKARVQRFMPAQVTV
jgi:hypothetical protein